MHLPCSKPVLKNGSYPSLVSIDSKLNQIVRIPKLRLVQRSQTQRAPQVSPFAADAAQQGGNKPRVAPVIRLAALPPNLPSIVIKLSIPAAPFELKNSPQVLLAHINKALVLKFQVQFCHYWDRTKLTSYHTLSTVVSSQTPNS